MTTAKGRMVALLIAVTPLMAAACEGTTAGAVSPPRKGDRTHSQVNPPEKPSCDEVGGPRGISGQVVGAEWVEPDGVTCLEVETKTGHTKLVRVSRRVFDRCLEGDSYPRCAHTVGDGLDALPRPDQVHAIR